MVQTYANSPYSPGQAPAESAADLPHPVEPPESINLIELAIVLAERKRFIVLCTAICTLLAIVIALILPQTFTASATMLPPQKDNSASAFLGQLGGLAALGGGGAAGMLGLKNPGDLYIGLLQSETITDALVKQFHLMRVYKTKKLSDARGALKGHTTILSEKSSLIRIAVKDHDPVRAAAIANAYIAQLHDLMSHLAVTEAAQRRIFFEQQVNIEKAKLADAEAALQQTEQRTGIIQPQGQAEAVIGTIMQLQAQISATEVELGALRTSATDQNPEVITLQSQLAGLKSQLASFEKGHPQARGAIGDVLRPASQVPAAALEYMRRYRDVRYHQTLFDLMARQYEMARVDEAKQAQMIQVVDPALVPDRRSWPPRTLLVLLALILGAALSSFWVLLQSAYRFRMRDPEFAAQTGKLRQMLAFRS